MALKDFMNKQFLPEISEGEHKATIKSFQFVENKEDSSKDYLRIIFNIENCGNIQEYGRNMFERDMSVMLSHTRRQLHRENEVLQPLDYLKELIAQQTPLSVWVEYRVITSQNKLKRVQNLYFQQPLNNTDNAEDDSETPIG